MKENKQGKKGNMCMTDSSDLLALKSHWGLVQTPLHSCAEPTEVLSTAKERRLNQFGMAVLIWCGKNVKFNRVCRII